MEIKALLRRYQIQPSRGLGQNFLIAEGILERILEASDLGPEDTVLEVGPGLGLLTRRLAERASAVVAVELDRKLLPILSETLHGLANVHIVQGDILDLNPPTTLAQALGLTQDQLPPYRVVANLPYYITSAVLRHLLAAHPRPTRLTLMVQREVAERLLAGAGALSVLALSVQVYGQVECVCAVPPTAFYPPPQVHSAVLRVQVYPQPRVSEEQLPAFFRVVRAGFGQKRKQLHNSLTHNLGLSSERVAEALHAAGVAPQRRAETLSIEEWQGLAGYLV